MCNNSVYGGIVFPSFVANSCCNPCCRNSGSVGGTSNSNTSNRCTCTCTCNNGSTDYARRQRQMCIRDRRQQFFKHHVRLRLPPVRMQFLLVRLRRRHVHRLLLRVQQLQQLQFLPPLRLLLHDVTTAPSGALHGGLPKTGAGRISCRRLPCPSGGAMVY